MLELPRVMVGGGLLTVRTVVPPQVTAGIAFTYSLQVRRRGRRGRSGVLIDLNPHPALTHSHSTLLSSPPLSSPPRCRT